MGPSRQFVELNGQKYDSVTGKIITEHAAKKSVIPTVAAHSKPKSSPKGTQMDGIVKTRSIRSDISAGKLHATSQTSHTLMRKTVKRPTPIIPDKSHKTSQPHAPKSASARTTQSTPEIIKPERVIRAFSVPKSNLISKFGSEAKQSIKTAVIPVRPEPKQHHTAATPHQTAIIQKDRFKHAVESATSHTQPKIARRRLHHKVATRLHIHPRAVLAGTGVMIALVVTGVVAYTKVPSVAMQVAATRAGINAALPTYHPAGFSLKGPISYTPGQVSLQYQSNVDKRDYKLIQQTSSLNSETLLSTMVNTDGQSYQTYQANGRTIYIYDGNNATWVDGGVLYRIEGNTNLNTDQLLKIANSL